MSRIKTHAGGSLCPAATSRLFAKTSAIHIRAGKPGRLTAKKQKYVMFNSGSIKFYNCFLVLVFHHPTFDPVFRQCKERHITISVWPRRELLWIIMAVVTLHACDTWGKCCCLAVESVWQLRCYKIDLGLALF